MSNAALTQAIENIYTSLHNDNADLDACIAALKVALDGEKEATFDSTRLPENSRQGRRVMQAYFKKRGIIVNFG